MLARDSNNFFPVKLISLSIVFILIAQSIFSLKLIRVYIEFISPMRTVYLPDTFFSSFDDANILNSPLEVLQGFTVI